MSTIQSSWGKIIWAVLSFLAGMILTFVLLMITQEDFLQPESEEFETLEDGLYIVTPSIEGEGTASDGLDIVEDKADNNQKTTNNSTTSSSSSSSSSSETDFNKKITISATYYSTNKGYLVSGDRVYVTAIRSSPNTALTSTKFESAISTLNSISTSGKGVEKSLLFSSYTDMSNFINQVPSNVKWISYNTEGGMTPNSELNNLVNNINQFAGKVHQTGRKAAWGPTIGILDYYKNQGKLNQILPKIDLIGLQGQKILAQSGMNSLKSEVKSRSKLYKSYNSKLKFSLQLVVGYNSQSEMVTAFTDLKSYIDYAVIFSTQGGSTVTGVIKKLR